MGLPEPLTRTFSSLISDIETGKIKIPQFQRDFVWTMQKSAALLDSILKGYPIGTFIFWRTKDRLRSIRELGGKNLPEPQKGEPVDYVLDGQQRLTSLFACLKGMHVQREGGKKTDDFSKIYINLQSEKHDQIVVTEKTEPESSFISILELLKGDFTILAGYPREYHEKMKFYQKQITSYQYPIIQIKDAEIDIATEIFTRINVGGKPLSLFEIMVAKTFDFEKNFDLSEKYKQLIETLEPVHYGTISDATVLQTVSIIMSQECKRQSILALPQKEFIDTWDKAVDAIENAVEYFTSFYRIPTSQLLPYKALIVPFSYFFFKHKNKPTGKKQQYLQDFFWRCSLSGRYSSSVESKLAQDIKKIDEILADNLPAYDWPIDSSPKFITANGWFGTGRSYIKAILCIYAHYEPKSFIDDSIVNIRNYWLKQANSKNYHHFFPKAYLKDKKDEFRINHILNITIVDDFLNKRVIGTKPPSEYMKKFDEKNPSLSETMKSHLIDDLHKFGVWNDDYDSFFEKRAERVSKEIEKRLIKQDVDEKAQPDLQNDSEAVTTVAE